MSSLIESSSVDITSRYSNMESKRFLSKHPSSPDSALGSDYEADEECANLNARKPAKILFVPSPSPTLDCINGAETNGDVYEELSNQKRFTDNKLDKKRTCSESSKDSNESLDGLIAEISRQPIRKIELPPPSISSQKKLAARPDYIRRPMNAFMIWSQITRRQVIERDPERHNAEISRSLGRVWRELPAKFKEPYSKEAEKLRIQHMRDYPDYKYKPKKKNKPLKKPTTSKEISKASSVEQQLSIAPAINISPITTKTVKDPLKRKMDSKVSFGRSKTPKLELNSELSPIFPDQPVIATSFNPIQIAVSSVIPQTSYGANQKVASVKTEPLNISPSAAFFPLSTSSSKIQTPDTKISLIKGTVLKTTHEGSRQYIIVGGDTSTNVLNPVTIIPTNKSQINLSHFEGQQSTTNLINGRLTDRIESNTTEDERSFFGLSSETFQESVKGDIKIDLNQLTLGKYIEVPDPSPYKSHFQLPDLTSEEIQHLIDGPDFSWELDDVLR